MTVVRLANMVLWLAALGMAYLLIDGLLGADVALLATTLIAWDNLINFVKYANYEVFLAFLMNGVLLSVWRGMERKSSGWLTLSGLLGGCACLVQGKSVVPLALVGAGAVLWRLGEAGQPSALGRAKLVLGMVIPAVGAFGLVVLPYVLYNGHHTGRYTFVAAVGPINLLTGNGPHANGEWIWTPLEFAVPIVNAAPDQQMSAAIRLVAPAILKDPVSFLTKCLPRKIYYFWGLDTIRHNIFFVAMFLGFFLHVGQVGLRSNAFLLWIPVVSTALIHLVYYGFERYRYPILPGIHAYTAFAIVALLSEASTLGSFARSRSGDGGGGVGRLLHATRGGVWLDGTGRGSVRHQYLDHLRRAPEPLVAERGGATVRCGPTIRRVHDCYYAMMGERPRGDT